MTNDQQCKNYTNNRRRRNHVGIWDLVIGICLITLVAGCGQTISSTRTTTTTTSTSGTMTSTSSTSVTTSTSTTTTSTTTTTLPYIQFTHVPDYGVSNEALKGQVNTVDVSNYKVAVYIYVSGWYNKPSWGSPSTSINLSGTWECDINTAGTDKYATRIEAFLIPNSYSPPQANGESTLPAGIIANSIGSVEARRHMLYFSGSYWDIKDSSGGTEGPGPNYFSNSTNNVTVDASGYLHLKITHDGGIWNCAEIISEDSLGNGKYIFNTGSHFDQINKNAVLGLFTWDDAAPYNHREIDIELSRWGDPAYNNSQYVVQPYSTPANIHRFETTLESTDSVHSFNWQPSFISFESSQGTPINSFYYTGADNPPHGDEHLHMNLWLYQGVAPSDGLEPEIIIKNFEFIP